MDLLSEGFYIFQGILFSDDKINLSCVNPEALFIITQEDVKTCDDFKSPSLAPIHENQPMLELV